MTGWADPLHTLSETADPTDSGTHAHASNAHLYWRAKEPVREERERDERFRDNEREGP